MVWIYNLALIRLLVYYTCVTNIQIISFAEKKTKNKTNQNNNNNNNNKTKKKE